MGMRNRNGGMGIKNWDKRIGWGWGMGKGR